jgi:hypothetical protein
MAQRNKIDVTVYPTGEYGADNPNGIEFSDVNYISLVTSETYGIPALLSEQKTKDEGLPVTILYINPSNIVAYEAKRTA